jgi:hypothetical protein
MRPEVKKKKKKKNSESIERKPLESHHELMQSLDLSIPHCQSLWADFPLKLYGQPDRLENHIFVLIPRTQRLE